MNIYRALVTYCLYPNMAPHETIVGAKTEEDAIRTLTQEGFKVFKVWVVVAATIYN